MIITEEGARAEPPDHQDHTPRSHRASTHSSSFTPNRVFCVSNLISWTHFSGRPKSFAPVPQKRGPSACTYLKRKTLPKALRTQALTAFNHINSKNQATFRLATSFTSQKSSCHCSNIDGDMLDKLWLGLVW